MAEKDFNILSFKLYLCLDSEALEDFVAEVKQQTDVLTEGELATLRELYVEQKTRIQTGKQFD